MEVDSAYSLIARAIDAGQTANGYLIVGDVRGNASELAGRILKKLFPLAGEQIENRTHPDVVWLEPEGKSRIIKVESMREKLVEPMNSTSFSGGWKVGVVCGADRMREEAANAFLKTLEEPTPKTMFLLLTDAPDAILPTIVSRTQRVELEVTGDFLDPETMGEIVRMVREKDVYGLVGMLKELKESEEPENEAIVKKAFFGVVMREVRNWMVRGRLEDFQAFRNVEAVETAYRQCERMIGDDAAISQMMDRLVCG